MDGSIKIYEVSKSGKKTLLIFFNQIADDGLKELAKLLPPNSTGILGSPITHCQLGRGGIGGQYDYDAISLNTPILESDGGISSVSDASVIHDGFTSYFEFVFNSDNTLYTYLNSIGNPAINEVGMLIDYTIPSTERLFCAKDFNYGSLPFYIESGKAYTVYYELKFGREFSSSSSV